MSDRDNNTENLAPEAKKGRLRRILRRGKGAEVVPGEVTATLTADTATGKVTPEPPPAQAEKTGRSARLTGRGKKQRPESPADAPQQNTAIEPLKKPKEPVKQRLRRAMSKTGRGFGNLFPGKRTIDNELFDELEALLLMADIGVESTAEIIRSLTDSVKRKELHDSEALYKKLQQLLAEILQPAEAGMVWPRQGPAVILVVGVNGVGKTTTIGKLARRLQAEGKSVMLAAGDTFRAAAVEQLQAWGERNGIPVVAQHTGADSASVIYDAIASGRSRNVDVIIADTAGRLHNKSNLMEELRKVCRVTGKLDASAPHEVLLVLDAGTGQNGLSQMQEFHRAVGVTGIAVTKLDGTAKGGIIFALCKKFGVPIRYIGIGEGVDDLQPFKTADFIEALFNRDTVPPVT